MTDCNHNIDPLKLIRDGTSQDQRPFEALDPAYAPVNEMTPAHSMVFAQAYAAYLRYFNESDVPVDDWKKFFGNDVSLLLAIAAVQDVDYYKTRVLEFFQYLNNHDNKNAQDLDKYLAYLFACAGTMAKQLDVLKDSLPPGLGLKSTLQNLIKTQLSEGFGRLISYYKGGKGINPVLIDETNLTLDFNILGSSIISFNDIVNTGLSTDWQNGSTNWATYVAGVTSNTTSNESVYGDLTSLNTDFDRINHATTHNLFTSVFDQLLKVYARTVAEAKKSLESTFTNWDSHEPHYTLFLAFLRLFEYARTEMNTLTGRHLDFYYKDVLQLNEKSAQPGHAHLLIELAKHATAHEIKKDALFKAGKDGIGKDAFFTNDRDFVANQAKVSSLKTLYRHEGEPVNGNTYHKGRLFASPVANSEDGIGGELTNADKSWHPFYNKIYDDGLLKQIKMPPAEIGFAIASHHLLMAEGKRVVTLDFSLDGSGGNNIERKEDVVCMFSHEKGWFEIVPTSFNFTAENTLQLKVILEGSAPSITPYQSKIHGYNLDTDLPVMLLKLQHTSEAFRYADLQNTVIDSITLNVQVIGLRTLAVSNDYGPIDTSKPFQPFGPSPVANSVFIIGSKEIFQKRFLSLTVNLKWQNPPLPFGRTVTFKTDFLKEGKWQNPYRLSDSITSETITLTNGLPLSWIDTFDSSDQENYDSSSLHGFMRFRLETDFGQSSFENALISYIGTVMKTPASAGNKPIPPSGPFIKEINLDYVSTQTISLGNGGKEVFEKRAARFFHILPFGNAEQHPFLKRVTPDDSFPDKTSGDSKYDHAASHVTSVSMSAISGGSSPPSYPKTSFSDDDIHLLPPMRHINKMDPAMPIGESVLHEAEFYIGITGLKPPQNLALLFQVAEGTADPLSTKPNPHLHWSYLSQNRWMAFEKNTIEDQSGELTRSGIVTLAIPRDSSNDNTLLPSGMHWIRIAVEKESDTVCRFILVAAQALTATFINHDNDPGFSSTPLTEGTISKLDQPDSSVKKIIQPFATFGGRGKEATNAYYTRVSERLRHKERAITLWDYERLVLEEYPQIYKVKCLNHTQYEPNLNGDGIYRELAAGHVTIVTIPNQHFQNLRDPLRPYTSLGLLLEIEEFIRKRVSCFAKLHVKNPQFEEIRVDFQVRFHPGFDETYYTNQLKREITRFLSPWAFSGGAKPSFGGKIYKSELINFVEERPFVDYVTDFKLFHSIGVTQGNIDLNEVEGATAVSILVSAPEEKHTINPILIAIGQEQISDACPCQS